MSNSKIQLEPRFKFKEIDSKWVRYWEDNNIFHGASSKDKKPYTITIPPPNVTGILHMGHALNNTLQDIIIRYKRMKGFEACWMPGTDHAGIATQNVVEKALAQEGQTRQDVGREKFTEKLWDWKQEYGDTIINQLKQIGASCDWPRTRFTMDDGYSEAVKKVFIELYNKELIYQGQYIINWCPRCQTALSDEEAEHQEIHGALYHIKYPIKDSDEFVTIATTRPETMLGDTAVAVNPKDKRYKKLIGQKLILPVMNRELEVISDSFVNPEFGTGAVKVTPAHDPNDFEMGQRHSLESINIMHPDARLNKNAGDFEGMDRFEAREALVKTLKDEGVLIKVEDHNHAVGHCYRCNTVVEPYLSKQWFVKMAPLAKPAIDVVKKGKVKFYPKRWEKVYLNWMENIRDWCISRQIWWGHRIPVWYDDDGTAYVAHDEVEARTQAKEKHGQYVALRQDEDVLDTWFSSWLWPFATFGWPEENDDLKFFYPGDALFTASEIIFFWVARMIMAGIEFRGDIPFSDVYIHGTVRDAKGQKMSKSLGNAIDPLDIVNEYGGDALRFSLIINSGQDLYVSKEKFEIGRNFANKIWNAARLILMNMTIDLREYDLTKDVKSDQLDLPSQWIISRFQSTLKETEAAIERYRYSEAESLIYEFFWNNFCDWYLEIIKNKLGYEDIQKVTFSILINSLKIIHPFMPFVTEELWENINIADECLARTPWPEHQKALVNKKSEDNMQLLIEVITSIRNARAQWSVKQNEKVNCHIFSKDKTQKESIANNQDVISLLSKLNSLVIEDRDVNVKDSATGVVQKTKFCIPLGEIINIEKEKKRILTEIESQQKASSALSKRLDNKEFLKKAPRDIVEKEQDRLESLENRIKELKSVIKNIV